MTTASENPAPHPGVLANNSARRINQFLRVRTTMRDNCNASIGPDFQVNVFIPADLSHLHPEIKALSEVPVFFHPGNRLMHMPDAPIDAFIASGSDGGEAERNAETEFVFGCVSASDGIEAVLISLACDWNDERRMSDYYTDAQREAIEQAFTAAGLAAYELVESTYELDGHTAEQARAALSGVEHFKHDAAFEQFCAW